MKMKSIVAAALVTCSALEGAQAADSAAPVYIPKLELVYTAEVGLTPIETVGETRDGVQRIIPITGGTFAGPAIRGTIRAGAADWNLARHDGTTVVEAYYFLKTSDGVQIKILNRGVIPPRPAGQTGGPPLFTTPVFDAPKGKYDWLNSGVYVGTITPGAGGKAVTIRVFRVT